MIYYKKQRTMMPLRTKRPFLKNSQDIHTHIGQ